MTVRLHRVPALPSFRRALVDLLPLTDIEAARATAVIVPTRSAAALLRRLIEDGLAPGRAAVLPDLLTRREWYERLAERAAEPPRLLDAFERDVLMEAAAHAAITDGATPPFHLRSALVGEIVALYDAIRRQRQDVAAFERLVVEPLGAEAEAEGDAGAERMLRQSRFLAASFRGYEARRDALGQHDEHTLRDWLVATPLARPYRRVVVAVADQSRDPNGLWSADADLLSRLPGVESVHIVATEGTLATGFLERLHDWLPGLETVQGSGLQGSGLDVADSATPAAFPEGFDAPRLLTPAGGVAPGASVRPDPVAVFASRDREEELRDLVRRIRALDADPRARVPLSRVGVVFERPLPYVYLAREVFGRGGVPFEARDALPLAAEPFAAAVDLVLSCPGAAFSRPALAALLASPHFRFGPADAPLDRLDVAALDAALEEADHFGDADRLDRLADAWTDGAARSPFARWDAARAARAGRVAAGVIRALAPLDEQAPASVQLDRLRAFVEAHLAPVGGDDPLGERLLRARQAVMAILAGLAAAHRAHHDLLWTLGDLAADVRHRIEGETFTPATGEGGVQLVDAAAAPFGGFDTLHLVGLVDGEWPRRPRRNLFYSAGLLAALGWPGPDTDALAPARAAFVDLLQSPARHVSVSTFALEDDTLVEPSSLIDDIPRAGLTAIPLPVPDVRVFEDEYLADAGASGTAGDARANTDAIAGGPAARWAALRASRPPAALPRFHGAAGAQPTRPRSVSALELYAQCPFKFYARYVLRLAEERDDEDGLTPLERGRLHHQLFEAVFSAWQQRGRGAITPERLDEARALAIETMEAHLARLPPAEAALERTRLVGSPVAPGLIDVVLRLEAERPTPVVERRLEHEINGVYRFRGPSAASGPSAPRVAGAPSVASGASGAASAGTTASDTSAPGGEGAGDPAQAAGAPGAGGGVREIHVRGIADRIDLLADGTFRVLDYKASRPGSSLQIAVYAICARQKLQGYKGRDWALAEAAYIAFRGDRTVVPLATRPGETEAALAEAEAEVIAITDAIARGEFPPRPRSRSLCASCAFAAVCRKDYVDADEPAPAV